MVVYTYLMGGLGNQMFQIATGLSHGIDNNDSKIYFSEKTNLGITATQRKDYNDTIFEYLPRLKEPTHMRIYSERGFEYQKLEKDFDTFKIDYLLYGDPTIEVSLE